MIILLSLLLILVPSQQALHQDVLPPEETSVPPLLLPFSLQRGHSSGTRRMASTITPAVAVTGSSTGPQKDVPCDRTGWTFYTDCNVTDCGALGMKEAYRFLSPDDACIRQSLGYVPCSLRPCITITTSTNSTVINPSDKLSLVATVRSAAGNTAYHMEWSDAGNEVVFQNSTALASVTTNADYLVVKPGSLQAGRDYTFIATVTDDLSSESAQATIRITVNKVPFGGTVSLDRYSGTVADTFTVSCKDWIDPDTGNGDALVYQYAVDVGGSASAAFASVVLQDWSHDASYSHTLPLGTGMMLRVSIRASCSLATITQVMGPINTTTKGLAVSIQTLALNSTLSVLRAASARPPSTTTDLAAYTYSLLPGLYSAAALLNAMPVPAPALRALLLSLADDLTSEQGRLNLSLPATVESLASTILLATAKPKDLTPNAMSSAVRVLTVLTTGNSTSATNTNTSSSSSVNVTMIQNGTATYNATLSGNRLRALAAADPAKVTATTSTGTVAKVPGEQATAAVVSALSNLMAGGALNQARQACGSTNVMQEGFEKILDAVHASLVSDLYPGEGAVVLRSPHLEVSSQVVDARTLLNTPDAAANAAATAGASSTLDADGDLLEAVDDDQLCQGHLELQSIVWGYNPYYSSSCRSSSPSVAASSSLLSSSTPVSTFNVGTCAGRKSLRISNLTTPLNMTLPSTSEYMPVPVSYAHRCQPGLVENITVQCKVPDEAASSGINLPTVLAGPFEIYCNGTSSEVMMAPECPVFPFCLYWDKLSKRWSDQGCQWISTDENGTQCQCSHLTDFSTYFMATYTESHAIVSQYRDLTPQTLRQNYGIVVGLAVLWLAFAVLLVKTRRNQARELDALLLALRESDIFMEVLTHVRRCEATSSPGGQPQYYHHDEQPRLDPLESLTSEELESLAEQVIRRRVHRLENALCKCKTTTSLTMSNTAVRGPATEPASTGEGGGQSQTPRLSAWITTSLRRMHESSGSSLGRGESGVFEGAEAAATEEARLSAELVWAQQSLLVLLVQTLTLFIFSVVFYSPSNLLAYQLVRHPRATYHLLIEPSTLLSNLYQNLQQCIMTIPVTAIFQTLYLLVNQDNRSKVSLLWSLLRHKGLYSYDYLLACSSPSQHPPLPVTVPALRLRLFQLEVVRKLVQLEIRKSRPLQMLCSPVPDQQQGLESDLDLIAKEVAVCEKQLERRKREAMRMMMLRSGHSSSSSMHVLATTLLGRRLSRRLQQLIAPVGVEDHSLPPSFWHNPLEYFDPNSHMARRFDDWMTAHLKGGCLARLAYQYLGADVSGSISYSRRTTIRLALMDGLVLAYLLAGSFYILLFGLFRHNLATVACVLADFSISVMVSNLIMVPLLCLLAARACQLFTKRIAGQVQRATQDFLLTLKTSTGSTATTNANSTASSSSSSDSTHDSHVEGPVGHVAVPRSRRPTMASLSGTLTSAGYADLLEEGGAGGGGSQDGVIVTGDRVQGDPEDLDLAGTKGYQCQRRKRQSSPPSPPSLSYYRQDSQQHEGGPTISPLFPEQLSLSAVLRSSTAAASAAGHLSDMMMHSLELDDEATEAPDSDDDHDNNQDNTRLNSDDDNNGGGSIAMNVMHP